METNQLTRVSLVVLSYSVLSFGQNAPPAPQQKLPPVQQTIEVTATRFPEDPEDVPTAIEVFTGDELRDWGTRDLRSALASAIGVEVAPGGDGGPASAVPDFWGLKERDAFLLVVDGVPSGGAFSPALTSLNLSDIDRIEVLRGPAAVTYGATSFVGVIHVVHQQVDSQERTLTLQGGSFGTGSGSFSSPLPLAGSWASRLTIEGAREGFRDDRTAFRRGHGLWRVGRQPVDSGRVWLNADLDWLNQDPASPRPREGQTLSPLVPADTNHNPAASFLNDHRFTGTGGFDRDAVGGHWFTTISVSHSRQDILRGFLQDLADVPTNAHGLREKIHLTDVYFDTHLTRKLRNSLRLLIGLDYLNGTGNAQGADFDYTVPLSGSPAPVVPVPSSLDVRINDRRNFFGPYSTLEWTPVERFRIDAGIRVNVTHEGRKDVDGGAGTSKSSTRTDARPGASVGAILNAWRRKQDSIGLFINYRDTFKPAAIDFGIGESRAGKQILDPETSRSVEGGLKGRFLDRRLEAEASGFVMDFSNLVTPVSVGGLPALINAGTQRLNGFESGLSVFLRQNVIARATYSFHDAKFTDFVQDFGGVPRQLAGTRLEMSARHLAGFAIQYAAEPGLLAGFEMSYTGSRFLNRRNTALTGGFASVGLNAGYRTRRWELRVDARNLGNRRDPVSESELGDAQYYLLPSRRVDGTVRVRF